MKRLLVILAGLVLTLGVAYGIYRFATAERAPEIDYKTTKVGRQKLVAQVTASGTLSARVTVQVGSQVSGRVQEILVDWKCTCYESCSFFLLLPEPEDVHH